MIDEAKVAAEEKQRRREEEVDRGWSQGGWGNVGVIKGYELEKFNIYTQPGCLGYIKGMKQLYPV